ncbi:MAG: Flp pilus assembly complex ATPase component TadA [Candidatus Omnitrophica bacterium]|nr:Flp pilus assembly complex ATPase component TadA [Candidatus Omnitrophota bacterium]
MSLKEALTNSLIKKGLLTEAQLKEALDKQKEKGGDLKDILVELGYVESDDMISLLSQELGITPINLTRFKIDPEVLKLIPHKLAENYNIIPISKVENVITVAMDDPLNVFALDHIAALTHFKIIPIFAAKKDIQNAIMEYYEEHTYDEIEDLVVTMGPSQDLEIITGAREESMDTSKLIKSTKEAPVVKLANHLLLEAVKARASDILIEALDKHTRIRYRVDGSLKEVRTVPKELHSAVVSRFKVMSNLNIAERRLPQEGRFKMKMLQKEVDFRISVLPANSGEKVALRILDKSAALLNIEKLGFNEKTLVDLRKAMKRPHGMVLVAGPTGSGKTTTLYSLLKLLSTVEQNIVTVEDPIEYQLEGLNQVSARPALGLTFAGALRSILRQDPDVIMIGEVRDYETADIAIKSALTGHLLLTTLHTTTATGVISRLMNMGVEPFLISSSVILTAAQRLVRKICNDCKEPYELDEFAKESLGIKDKGKLTLHRGKGCRACLNTGYKGRTAIMETLVVTPEIRKLISERTVDRKVRDAAIAQGLISLREDGLEKARQGIITIEEVLRVTIGDQDIETKNI